MVVTCLNFFMYLWLAYRLRLTTAAVAAVISHAPRALAHTLPSLLIVFSPPTTQASNYGAVVQTVLLL